jgi:DNA-binding CsgD family transcriptional regulator
LQLFLAESRLECWPGPVSNAGHYTYRGRKKALSPEQVADLQQRAAAGEQKAKLAREFGVSRETLYQYLRLINRDMPRRSILSAAERESLLALPDTKDDLIRYYTFSDTDLSIIRQRRPANRLASPCSSATCAFPASSLASMSRRFRPC